MVIEPELPARNINYSTISCDNVSSIFSKQDVFAIKNEIVDKVNYARSPIVGKLTFNPLSCINRFPLTIKEVSSIAELSLFPSVNLPNHRVRNCQLEKPYSTAR